MLVDTGSTVVETRTATDLCKFPANWHKIANLLLFISWSLADLDDSLRANAQRYLDHIIDRFGGENEVHAVENLALVLRLVELLPRQAMRIHYTACFSLRKNQNG